MRTPAKWLLSRVFFRIAIQAGIPFRDGNFFAAEIRQ